MKKIFALTLGITALLSVFSCSKKDFDDRYYDPSKTTTVSCDKLMTGVFYTCCNQYRGFGYNTYWRLYTYESLMSQLTQQKGFNNNSGGVYYLSDSYATDRWNSFYQTLAQFRLLQATYENSTDKETDGVFLACSEVFILDQLAQIVDVFGPVPYSKAGYLGITGDLAASYPEYESDETLYKMMLDRLGELYNTLNGYATNPTPIVTAKMKAQDYINRGDLDKWVRYANSLRLRLAVHVAAKGSLTSTAQAVIKECAGRKLVDSMDYAIAGGVDTESAGGGKFWEWYISGFAGDGLNVTASQAIIDAMRVTGSDDPRLKIFYNPNEAGEFIGKSVNESSSDQTNHDNYNEWKDRYYATLDSVTFITNSCMKNYILSPAETEFLLAESYQQGYASGTAKDAFVKAVCLSMEEWFDRNMSSTPFQTNPYRHYKATAAPTTAEATAYANAVWDSYTNKLEAIMTQKWIHNHIMMAHESWTDIRRTGYPKLTYPADSQSQTNRNIIQRILYPNVEKSNNTANYNANAASFTDSNETVLFWAKKLQ